MRSQHHVQRLFDATWRAFAIGAVACGVTGCLSSSYTIKRDELQRLASAPAETRGEDVHVKQRFVVFSAGGAEPTPERVLVEVLRAQEVVRVTTREVAMGLREVREGVWSIRAAFSTTRERAAGTAPTPAAAKSEPPSEAPKSEEAPKSADHAAKKDEAKSDDASTALVVGAIVIGGVFIGTALALSEGQRFDGYMETDAEMPVHLFGPDGEIGWVPLRSLTPAMLHGVEEGVVSDKESRLVRTRVSPLDRRGFAYDFELGAGGMNALDRRLAPGFAARLTVGYFPVQRFGILAGAGFAIGPKGSVSTGTEIRPVLEADWFPVSFSRNHLGLYADGGYSFGSERLPNLDKQSTGTWNYGGGVLYQRDLNALLALTLRGGVVVFPDPGVPVVAPQLTLGFAVY